MTIFVELYGRLRDAGLESPVELELPHGATAAQALSALKDKLGAEATRLAGAALASETQVLAADEKIPQGGRLAALPPVSGG
jgi:molybdopterin converting factor small subunit